MANWVVTALQTGIVQTVIAASPVDAIAAAYPGVEITPGPANVLAQSGASQFPLHIDLPPPFNTTALAGIVASTYYGNVGPGSAVPWDQFNAFSYLTLGQIVDVTQGTLTQDCTSALQNWINACTTAKRRGIAPGGSYKITGQLTINTTGNYISGEGPSQTKFVANGNFASILAFNASCVECTVEGISLLTDGTTTGCVIVNQSATGIRFDKCSFSGTLTGALIYSNGQNLYFNESGFAANNANTYAINFDCFNQNCSCIDCHFVGVGNGINVTNVFSPSNQVEGLRVIGCYFINTGNFNMQIGKSLLTSIMGSILDLSTLHGVDIGSGASNVLIQGCWVGTSSVGSGIGIQINFGAGSEHVINGNTLAFHGTSIVITASASSQVSGVTITNNQFQSESANALKLDSVLNCIIANNTDTATPSGGSWITLATNAAGGSYKFSNNQWASTTPGSFHAGSIYTFQGDSGIAGQKKAATAFSAATSVTINHGLFTTPSKIVATLNTGATNPGAMWVNTLTSTQFTVTWTNSATGSVYWDATV